MGKKPFFLFGKSDKKDEKGGSEKAPPFGKAKKFAKGGLATTQKNLRTMGRGLAKVANQKSGGKMACGGKVK